jgi:phosphoserine phosphatase
MIKYISVLAWIVDALVLEVVGNPVTVYPDEPLRDLAVERGWRIIT